MSDNENVSSDVSNVGPVAEEKKVKFRKEYDHATKSYVMVPKNQPLKVLVSKPRTSKRWVVRTIKAQFKKVSFLDGVTLTKRISKRRAQNRIAAKTKWKNYHLAQDSR